MKIQYTITYDNFDYNYFFNKKSSRIEMKYIRMSEKFEQIRQWSEWRRYLQPL